MNIERIFYSIRISGYGHFWIVGPIQEDTFDHRQEIHPGDAIQSIMETKIESLLATFTLIAWITLLGMISSNVMAQELFLQPIGASLQQTSRHLEDFPQFHQTIVPNGLQIGCDGFSASYQFEGDSLQNMQVERHYHNAKTALASMEVSLLYIERCGATIVLLHRDSQHILYCAIAKDSAYEVDLSTAGNDLPTLKIRAWARAHGLQPSEHREASSPTALQLPTD